MVIAGILRSILILFVHDLEWRYAHVYGMCVWDSVYAIIASAMPQYINTKQCKCNNTIMRMQIHACEYIQLEIEFVFSFDELFVVAVFF